MPEFTLASGGIDLPDSLEEINEYLYERRYGDGLPVFPPTEERVRRFIEQLRRDPAEVVAVLAPNSGIATVEKVVINAVMAGCRPEYVPVVIAALEAFAEPAFDGRAVQETSNPAATLLVINGPIRLELGVSVGADCMGLGSRANLTIGRAVRLALSNIGRISAGEVGKISVVDKTCQGYPGKQSFCFGENEEQSPWEPLHVERGFRSDESTVTIIGAQGTSNINVNERPIAEDIMAALARGMINPGANNFAGVRRPAPLVVLNPGHARALADGGIGKSRLKEYLYEHARVPIEWYSDRRREAASLADRAIDGMIPVADSPRAILIVVAGAPGMHSTFIPTFADRAVTRVIRGTS